ncbi:MAG TPA: ATP-binding protein, partial [Dehalococcoidia bacterium]
LGITRDITELKRVEDRQRFLAEVGTALVGSLESGEVLATLARLAVPRIADGSVMYVVEEDGRIRRAAVVFQDAAKERAAASVFQSAAVTDDEVHPVARVIRSGTTLLVEQTTEAWGNASFRDPALRRLGEALGVRSLIIAPLSARGRTLGAVSFVQAESGRRYGPADLALVEDLARRAALAVDNARLYQEAQQAVRAREEFLSIASHELRTPLTTVKGYVQLLGRQVRQPEPDPARMGALTEQLELQVARLERLVADLLDASRIQQGRLELRPEPLDLRHLASEVLARFDHAPERTGAHRLVLDAPEPVSGSWDPARLDQVLSNLLSNALKYSPQGGPIRLSVRARGGWAEVAVADQGLGIPPEEQPNLFRPFARGATARRAVGGEGLGLYITQQIVQRHGGSIALTSEPGRGTTVTVRLPLTPPGPAAVPPEP